jgi:hypothetical protein
MQHVRVEGDAFERALQQAKHFGPGVLEEARAALGRLSVMPRWVPLALRPALASAIVALVGRVYLSRHGATLRGYGGGKFARGLDGLAQGFQASRARLYGFAAFEIEASRFSFTLGCTSLAFAAEATAHGRPVLAYNHDFPPSFGPFPFVRESVPSDGFSSVAVTYPTMLGAICGVNAAGLGVSLNHAWVRKLYGGEALPITMLVQDVLDRCADVEQAVATVKAQKVANGSMMTLVDARGARAAVELTPEGAFVRRTQAPVLHTFNAYQLPEPRRLEVPIGAFGTGTIAGMDIHGPNLARQARFDALGAGQRTGWTPAQIDALMADHGEHGEANINTVCRHPDPQAETLLTARVDPVERTLSVGLGTACQARLQSYGLHAALQAAA